jgi:hypothetical protein
MSKTAPRAMQPRTKWIVTVFIGLLIWLIAGRLYDTPGPAQIKEIQRVVLNHGLSRRLVRLKCNDDGSGMKAEERKERKARNEFSVFSGVKKIPFGKIRVHPC